MSKEVVANRPDIGYASLNDDVIRAHYRQPGTAYEIEGKHMEEQDDKTEMAVLTAEIVAAYVGNNVVPVSELPALIKDVHTAMAGVVEGGAEEPKEELKPAVSVRRSVTPDYIICLEDGKKFKSLKRHLRTAFNLTPEQYREKWGLKPDYPMVAPNYATVRSEMAKRIGLGRKRAS